MPHVDVGWAALAGFAAGYVMALLAYWLEGVFGIPRLHEDDAILGFELSYRLLRCVVATFVMRDRHGELLSHGEQLGERRCVVEAGHRIGPPDLGQTVDEPADARVQGLNRDADEDECRRGQGPLERGVVRLVAKRDQDASSPVDRILIICGKLVSEPQRYPFAARLLRFGQESESASRRATDASLEWLRQFVEPCAPGRQRIVKEKEESSAAGRSYGITQESYDPTPSHRRAGRSGDRLAGRVEQIRTADRSCCSVG